MDTLLWSIGSSVTVNGFIFWLAREWISVRLKASIQLEYDQKLEAHKAQLEAEKEIAIIDIKRSIDKEAALLSTANTAFSEALKVTIARRLDALDRLWGAFLRFRNNLPPIFTFVDVMDETQYKDFKKKPEAIQLLGDFGQEKIKAMFEDKNDSTEKTRPYVSEYLWWIFISYTQMFLSLLLKVHFEQDNKAVVEWYKDEVINTLVDSLLTTEEKNDFDKMEFGKISWLQKKLEIKMLLEIQRLVSSNTFSQDALDNAQDIQTSVSALNNSNEKSLQRLS